MSSEIVLNGKTYIEKSESSEKVLVRTYSAGVHFGELVSLEGQQVVLKNAQRLHYWEKAMSLSEVSQLGVDIKKSRISLVVPLITLTQAIEIIPMSKTSCDNMIECNNVKNI